MAAVPGRMQDVSSEPAAESRPAGIAEVAGAAAIAVAVLALAAIADRVVSSACAPLAGASGDLWALSLIASNVVGLGVLVLFLVIPDRGRGTAGLPMEELGFVPVPLAAIIRWTVVFLVASVIGEGLLQILGLPADAMPLMRAYRGAASLPLLSIAVAGTAPLFEEVLLRGFVFGRIERSCFGQYGAIVVTASTWIVLHFQYSVGALSFVALLALVFSLARARTGSVLPSLFLHVLNNVGLLLQTVVWAD